MVEFSNTKYTPIIGTIYYKKWNNIGYNIKKENLWIKLAKNKDKMNQLHAYWKLPLTICILILLGASKNFKEIFQCLRSFV